MGRMIVSKGECPVCHGQVVVEYIGNYGSVYKVRKDGNVSTSKKIRTIMYPTSQDNFMVYCDKCRTMFEGKVGDNDSMIIYYNKEDE